MGYLFVLAPMDEWVRAAIPLFLLALALGVPQREGVLLAGPAGVAGLWDGLALGAPNYLEIRFLRGGCEWRQEAGRQSGGFGWRWTQRQGWVECAGMDWS